MTPDERAVREVQVAEFNAKCAAAKAARYATLAKNGYTCKAGMRSCQGTPCQGRTDEAQHVLLERWVSQSGKHWVEIFHVTYTDFHTGAVLTSIDYVSPGDSGSFGLDGLPALRARIAQGHFQPDRNIRPMQKVETP